MSDLYNKRMFVVLLIICYFNCNKEVFADDVIFTQEMECTNNTLTLQCNLSDTNTVTDMYHMTILQRNISKLYEDVVTINLSIGSHSDKITWYNDTIKNISLTEGSSVIPANESRLIVQINLKRFEMREDSMMFRCKIKARPPTKESIQDLTVKIGCSSSATGQKIQAGYVLVYIIACKMLITIFSD